MATVIPWCDETLNVTAGCTKCSPGCLNCYAERMALRLACIEFSKYGQNMTTAEGKYTYVTDLVGKWNGKMYCDESVLGKPLHWKRPRRIFICSMSDLFHEKVPFRFIDKVHAAMISAYKGGCKHTYLILTKRPKRMLKYYSSNRRPQLYRILEKDYGMITGFFGINWPFPNVHLGVSISNQAEVDEKIPILLQIPAAVRFLSVEPMLEPIDLHLNWAMKDCKGTISSACTQLHGIIVGCESGPKRRPCKMEWIYGIINQCRDANIPCFVKQINLNGEVVKMPEGFPQELPK